MTMQIVACQPDIAWEDKPANFAHVRRLLSSASIKPGALVVLPEMFATGFSMHVDTIAEAPDGETFAFLAGLARDLQCFVVGGVVTRSADHRGSNEAAVFGPEGTLLARYAKLHPFSYAGETKHYASGEAVAVLEWHEFALAPFVCYDLRFPEIFRRAVRSGANVMAVIANWPEPRHAHWVALLKARAIENQSYVVGVNRAGSDPHVAYAGGSLILGPRGEVLAEAGRDAQVISAEIELAPLVEYRQQFPALEDIRPEFLGD